MMAAKGRFSRFPSRRSSSSKFIFLMLLIMFSFIILIILTLGFFSFPTISRYSTQPHDPNSIVHLSAEERISGDADNDDDDNGSRDPWIELISWKPRAVIFHNFLSKDECEHLINLAKPQMTKSAVVDDVTGENVDSRARTSTGTFLDRGQDETIQNIEERIAEFTFIPVEHGESLQILHYEVGQKYEPHYDFLHDDVNLKDGGQRIATVLMYLSDVEEGGETVFPNAKGNISSVPWWNELSECGKGGLSVKPKMGDALLFWSMNPDATLDYSSLHGGCSVIKGSKWSSTKWLHIDEYNDSFIEEEILISTTGPS